jgi:hypothetical protein
MSKYNLFCPSYHAYLAVVLQYEHVTTADNFLELARESCTVDIGFDIWREVDRM